MISNDDTEILVKYKRLGNFVSTFNNKSNQNPISSILYPHNDESNKLPQKYLFSNEKNTWLFNIELLENEFSVHTKQFKRKRKIKTKQHQAITWYDVMWCDS